MSQTRILMTADTVGGVWTFAIELCSALCGGGLAVDLATMGAPLSDTQRAQAEDVRRLRIFEGDFKLEWMEDSRLSVERAGLWLLDLERRLRPDVVHLNGYVHAALPWKSPVVVTGHSCVLSWWKAVYDESPPDSWKRYARNVRRGLNAAGTVIAPTHAMLESLQLHYGEHPSARVVPNGLPRDRFARGPKRQQILSVGRVWDAAKNVAASDRVASRLPWPVLVAGEARHPDGGSARLSHARPLGVLGPNELAREYARAAVFAAPALYEPFGLSALEAALSGCALVLGDIPSLREVWEDAALYVSPRDDEALHEALMRLIESPRLRGEYARRASERARTFTPERMALGYLDAYRDALGIVSPRAGALLELPSS